MVIALSFALEIWMDEFFQAFQHDFSILLGKTISDYCKDFFLLDLHDELL